MLVLVVSNLVHRARSWWRRARHRYRTIRLPSRVSDKWLTANDVNTSDVSEG